MSNQLLCTPYNGIQSSDTYIQTKIAQRTHFKIWMVKSPLGECVYVKIQNLSDEEHSNK